MEIDKYYDKIDETAKSIIDFSRVQNVPVETILNDLKTRAEDIEKADEAYVLDHYVGNAYTEVNENLEKLIELQEKTVEQKESSDS